MAAAAPPDASLAPALEALAARDPDIARVLGVCGLPPVRRSAPGFAGLIRMIAGQQVSIQSAAAIVARLETAARPLDPDRFLALDEADLKTIGFSRAKMRYGRALAEAIASGALDIAGLATLADEEAISALTLVPGIGRWTAEIYLLFALRRPDVWPAGDLAVVKAAQRLKGLAERPTEAEMRDLGEAWRPHRSAAARLLWHFYRHGGVALGADGAGDEETA